MPLLIAQGLFGLASTLLASCPAATFRPQVAFPAGGVPEGIAVADFDGDGAADLAVSSPSRTGATPSHVAILRGDGDGHFGAPVPFAVGRGVSRVVASDFDADGNVDVATLNGNDGTVSILLGDGLGGLGAQTVFPAGATTSGLEHGDFNGDGVDDLVVSERFASRIVVLLGVGDGSFAAPVRFPTGQAPLQLAVGDLDGDGHLDVADVDADDATVSVLLGRGDGSLAARTVVLLPRGVSPQSLALSDLDADRILDLVVTDAVARSVLVLPGRGDGSFDEATAYRVGGLPVFVAVGDLNGDGRPDLATGNGTDATVSVLVNVGDGTFNPQTVLAVGLQPIPVAIADFNGDGAFDVVAGNQIDETISLLTNGCTENHSPRADAGPDRVLECGAELGAVAVLDGSASSDPDSTPGTDDDIAAFAWFEGATSLADGRRASARLALGTHDVTLTVTDRAGAAASDASRITVQDTLSPTAITVSANPDVLATAPSRLVPVTISVTASDRCDPAPVCRIDSVTSTGSAPVPPPGGAQPDFIVVDPGPKPSPADLSVLLRAVRPRGGEVRSYQIAVSCADVAGNVVTGRTAVTVSRGRAGAARPPRSRPASSIPPTRTNR